MRQASREIHAFVPLVRPERLLWHGAGPFQIIIVADMHVYFVWFTITKAELQHRCPGPLDGNGIRQRRGDCACAVSELSSVPLTNGREVGLTAQFGGYDRLRAALTVVSHL